MKNKEVIKAVEEKQKHIPAYIRNKETVKKNIFTENIFAFKSKITKYIIPIVAVILVALIVSIIYIFIDSFKYKEYIKYEDKMNVYGFNKIYNNQSSKTSDSVTKTEALKMAISCIFNTYDISRLC